MKVCPVLRKSSKIDEIRMIRIDEKAMQELLFETLMENSREWFHLQDDSENIIFYMDWDKGNNCLSYLAVPIDRLSEVYSVDFRRKLRKSAITTPTLFTKHKYKTLRTCTTRNNDK